MSNSIKFSNSGGKVTVSIKIKKLSLANLLTAKSKKESKDKIIESEDSEDEYITKVQPKSATRRLSTSRQLKTPSIIDMLNETNNHDSYFNRFIIKIHDDGLGISKEDIGKLFMDFQKLKDSSGINLTGTGLGLSICKQLL